MEKNGHVVTVTGVLAEKQPHALPEKHHTDDNQILAADKKPRAQAHKKRDRFGWLGYRPQYLQRFNTGFSWGVAVTITSVANTFVLTGLLGLVITSLERRFDMRSNQTAWISNAAEISPVPVYILLVIFGKKAHRPMLVSLSTVAVAIGAMLFAVPHFTTDTYLPIEEVVEGNLCTDRDELVCDADDNLDLYMYVFIVARVLIGGGTAALNTVAITYLEDYTDRNSFGLLAGFIQGATVVGPAIAYAVGGSMLTMYTDFPTVSEDELGFGTSDPRWVGAWWLPYIVGSCFLMACVPMLLAFPKRIPGGEEILLQKKSEAYGEETAGNKKERNLKKEFIGVITNPVYLCCNAFSFLTAFIISGFLTFGAKYVENQYGLTAAMAGLIWGMTVVLGGVVGSLLGGYIVKAFSLTALKMIKVMMVSSVLACAMMTSLLLHCDAIKFAGVNVDYYNHTASSPEENPLISDCNADCTCTDIPFDPVCGSDSVRYYSPCYAGCTNYTQTGTDKEFYSCSCIPPPPDGSTSLPAAISGDCDSNTCSSLYIFLVCFFLIVVMLLMGIVLTTSVVMRIVRVQEQDVAIAGLWSTLRLFGNTPGTLVIGSVFNTNCLLWEDKCGEDGTCLALDVSKTSLHLTLLVIGVKLLSQICITTAYFVYNRVNQKDKAEQYMENAMATMQMTVEMDGADCVIKNETGKTIDLNASSDNSSDTKSAYSDRSRSKSANRDTCDNRSEPSSGTTREFTKF